MEQNPELFILLNTASPHYTHTQFQDIYGFIPPIIWIDSQDVAECDISNGEVIEIHNELGHLELQTNVTDNISKNVLWAPRQVTGIKGKPQNWITVSITQHIGGGLTLNSTMVNITKKNAS